MTQEKGKELLLKDLSARLLHGVICTDSRHGDSKITEINIIDETVYCDDFDEYVELDKIKPYLRPMSSITEEEISDLQKINSQFCFDKFDNFAYVGAADDGFCSVEEMDKILDYLNSKHFDFRGLIPASLAIEVTKENNPYEVQRN